MFSLRHSEACDATLEEGIVMNETVMHITGWVVSLSDRNLTGVGSSQYQVPQQVCVDVPVHISDFLVEEGFYF